jgi:hypothetical protein
MGSKKSKLWGASALTTAALAVTACVVNPPPATTAQSNPAPTAEPPTPATPAAPAPAAPAMTPPAAPATPTAAPATPVPATDPAQPAHQEMAPPTDKPHEFKLSVADGRPHGFKAGVPESYWIWHDDNGKWWHVRTSTHSAKHRFQGWVFHEKDRFTDVRPTRLEWNDRIKYGTSGASWDFETKGSEDGFDFRTNGVQCVRFHTFIDGKPNHDRVFIGAGGVHPPSAHFRICP